MILIKKIKSKLLVTLTEIQLFYNKEIIKTRQIEHMINIIQKEILILQSLLEGQEMIHRKDIDKT